MKHFMKHLLLVLLFFCSLVLTAQKKKQIKKSGIISVTCQEIKGSKKVMDSKTLYNEQGKISEEIKYREDGTLKSSTRYKYNKAGDVAMETEFNDKNIITEIKKYSYGPTGLKTEELFLSRDNKPLKKYIYSYNSKGLKTERKTYDPAGKLISIKQYLYGYK